MARRTARRWPRAGVRGGFTLVEAISTIVIVSVLVAVAAPAISSGMGGYADAATRAEMGAAASAAMERLCLEIQDIPQRTSGGTVAPAIDSVSPSSLTWSTNSSVSLSGTTLNLSKAGGSPYPLLTNVQTFSVQAYDQSNTALAASLSGAACDAIQRLGLTITVARGGVSETVRTRVFLRCLVAGAEP